MRLKYLIYYHQKTQFIHMHACCAFYCLAKNVTGHEFVPLLQEFESKMREGTRPNHKESDSPFRTEIVTYSETSTRLQEILKKMNSNKQWKQVSTNGWLLEPR